MKKMLFLAPLAALALVACSSDAVVEQSAQVLANKNGDLVLRPQVCNATRGTVITTSSLKKFDIDIAGSFQKGAEWTSEASASPITSISDVLTGSGSSWTFGTLTGTDKYWWNDNSTEATFQAKAPSGTSLTDFEPSRTDASAHVDLITAFNKGTRDEFKTGVPLNFKHALSQIIIQAKNADNSKVKIEVAGIRLKNVANKATLTPPTSSETFGTWSAPTGTDPYLFGETLAKKNSGTIASSTLAAAASNVVTGSPMFLIPQQLTEFSAISVLVRVTDLSKKVAKRTAEGKMSASGTEIEFNAYAKYDETTKSVTVSATPLEDVSTPNAYLGTFTLGAGDTEDTRKEALTKAGDVWTYTTYEEGTGDNAGKLVVKDTYTLDMENEVIFPRVGRGTSTNDFGYVYAPSAIKWDAGYKYTYTLNFGADSYGLVDADKASGEPDTTYPLGVLDFGIGGDATQPLTPDEPVVDTPVELFFTTVTVDEWQEGDDSAQNKDM